MLFELVGNAKFNIFSLLSMRQSAAIRTLYLLSKEEIPLLNSGYAVSET